MCVAAAASRCNCVLCACLPVTPSDNGTHTHTHTHTHTTHHTPHNTHHTTHTTQHTHTLTRVAPSIVIGRCGIARHTAAGPRALEGVAGVAHAHQRRVGPPAVLHVERGPKAGSRVQGKPQWTQATKAPLVRLRLHKCAAGFTNSLLVREETTVLPRAFVLPCTHLQVQLEALQAGDAGAQLARVVPVEVNRLPAVALACKPGVLMRVSTSGVAC